MAPRARPVISDDLENQSDPSSNLSEIFSDNGSDSDLSSDSELDSEVSNDEDKPSDNIFNNEGQRPPEHYLTQAENLNVSQLQQKRHSDHTQETLDETSLRLNKDTIVKIENSYNYLSIVLDCQNTVQKRKHELKNYKVKLEHVNKMYKTALKHLNNKVLTKSNSKMLKRLKVFCD
ncbi:hypothetical protein AJ78_06714 [Emergomyces pasteurianus Ep9510]|uniref:Uncharacterized protein n=1 Tax=Emergomyces pasteurianus Ep9510 TaxID=1447872 RepID=A0A1J9P8F0_9EURO|nr:hypothetical protein AJ78_06714 [Emergomyces pasteurianus Ep9510]